MEYLTGPDDNSLLGKIKFFFENINEPEQYEAASIRDFLDNAGIVKPTRKLLPGTSKYNGFGMVWLADRVKYHNLNELEGIVSDLSGELTVRLDPVLGNGQRLTNNELKQLVDGATLFQVMLLYNPKSKMTYLYQWGDYDEEIEDKEPNPKKRSDLILKPSQT